MERQKPVVAYYYDEESGNYCYTVNHPWRPHRSKLVHNIVTGYNLEKEMIVHRPRARTFEELTEFHADGEGYALSGADAEIGRQGVCLPQPTSDHPVLGACWWASPSLQRTNDLPRMLADYINFMKQVTPETTQEYMNQLKRFNMGSPGESDCPVFDGMYEYFAVRGGIDPATDGISFNLSVPKGCQSQPAHTACRFCCSSCCSC
jgi:histone deacetylase 1/2